MLPAAAFPAPYASSAFSFNSSNDVDEIAASGVAISNQQQQQQYYTQLLPPNCDDGVFLATTSFSNNQPLPPFHHHFHPPPQHQTSFLDFQQQQQLAAPTSSSSSVLSVNNNTASYILSRPATANKAPLNKGHVKTSSSTSSSATHQVRKERSRRAARNRRGRENKEFEQLANLLPFEQGIASQLDKASIVRLVISYLKLRAQTPFLLAAPLPSPREIIPPPTSHCRRTGAKESPLTTYDFLYEKCHGARIQEALEGFMLVFEVAPPGRILYVSQTVANFTGLALVDLIGRSIYDYLHQDDANEISHRLVGMCSSFHQSTVTLQTNQQQFCYENDDDDDDDASSTSSSSSSPLLVVEPAIHAEHVASFPVGFHARFRCTANKRGNFFRVPGYRLFSLVGRICQGVSINDDDQQPCKLRRPQDEVNAVNLSSYHFVGTALALPSVSISEYNLAPDQIVFKLDNYLKIVDYDANNNASESYCNWFSTSFLPRGNAVGQNQHNTTLYDICHPGDAERLRQAYHIFLTKNQAMISGFRICSDRESFHGNLWLAGVQPASANNNLPTSAVPNNAKQQQQQQQQSPISNSSSSLTVANGAPSDSSSSSVSIIALFTPVGRCGQLFSTLPTTRSNIGDLVTSSPSSTDCAENGTSPLKKIRRFENGSYTPNFALPNNNFLSPASPSSMMGPTNVIQQNYDQIGHHHRQVFTTAAGFACFDNGNSNYHGILMSPALPPTSSTIATISSSADNNNNDFPATSSFPTMRYCLN